MANEDKAAAEVARQRAKAISRWEGEGGALGTPAKTLDETDLRILGRLGAAVLGEWETLSDTCRAAIFQRASTLHAETDAALIKAQIARFLNDHKDR